MQRHKAWSMFGTVRQYQFELIYTMYEEYHPLHTGVMDLIHSLLHKMIKSTLRLRFLTKAPVFQPTSKILVTVSRIKRSLTTNFFFL